MAVLQLDDQQFPLIGDTTRIGSGADRLLKRAGRMIRAIETSGPGDLASEGRPFRLDLD